VLDGGLGFGYPCPMIETITDMPSGTLGFRSAGDLTGADYRETLVPPIRETIERGEKIRLLFVVEPGFKETPGGLFQDLKTGATLGAGHLSSWEKTALVTDQDWVTRAVHLFGWLAPGEVRLFPLAQVEEAKVWLAT